MSQKSRGGRSVLAKLEGERKKKKTLKLKMKGQEKKCPR